MANKIERSDTGELPRKNDAEAVNIINKQKDVLTQAGYTNIAAHFYELLEPGDKPGRDNYILTDKAKEKLPAFTSKLLTNEYIAKRVEERVKNIDEKEEFLRMLFKGEDQGVIDSERNFNFLINNIEARKKEVEKNVEEVEKRVKENPIASEDELILGIYKESIESQVRDAVLVLSRKGYSTFQSGFRNAADGAQFMDFNKKSTKGKIELSPALTASLNQHGVTAYIDTSKVDRDSLILIPQVPEDSKPLDLSVWREVWDNVASDLPEVDPIPMDSRFDFQKRFALTQQKIRSNEDVYIGYGIAYFDGKPQRMTFDEFSDKSKKASDARRHVEDAVKLEEIRKDLGLENK